MTALITDPGFDLNRTEEYKLSIQVSLDGFSFSVIHLKQNKLLALEFYQLKLSSEKFLGRRFSEWLDSNEILSRKYSDSSLVYCPESFTFIPSPFYDYNYQTLSGNLVLGNNEGLRFIDNYLPDSNGNIVFPVSSEIFNTVESRFPKKFLQHPLTILDAELRKLTNLKEITLAIFFRQNSFNLILYSDSKLLLANSYRYNAPDDVLYYVLSAMKKFNVPAEKTNLFMAGEIKPKSKIHTSLKKYFNRTIFFTPDIHFSTEIFKEPLHRYIVLF